MNPRRLLSLAGLFAIMGLSTAAALPVSSSQSPKDTKPQEGAMVAVRPVGPEGKPGDLTEMPRVAKSDEAWEKQLGPAAYRVLRAKGTEAPFCGNLLDNHRDGVYFCAGCGLPLFSSGSKFHSGTGWPSFYEPFAKENITELRDISHGMIRTEILCTLCGGHLGHVFEDGPPPTGLRYCLNSVSLTFRDDAAVKSMAAQKQGLLPTAP